MNITQRHFKNILTRGLPKTGQTVCYRAGDDGDDAHEAGWWLRRLNANNRQRFIARTIGGDDVVLDRATGLIWAADGHAAGCNNAAAINWAPAIDYANGLDFAGFTDWRLPNIKELSSIVDYSRTRPAIYLPYFPNTDYDYYWSSTTFDPLSLNAWAVDFEYGHVWDQGKSSDFWLRCVRGGV